MTRSEAIPDMQIIPVEPFDWSQLKWLYVPGLIVTVLILLGRNDIKDEDLNTERLLNFTHTERIAKLESGPHVNLTDCTVSNVRDEWIEVIGQKCIEYQALLKMARASK